ncbi:MAG: tyrosine-type recombinase/integrase [Novosphingobium sp.]
MASIKKTGSKYHVRWRDPDGSERTRSCPDHATARELKRDVERTRALGLRWEAREAAKVPSLAELRELYIRFRASRKAGKTVELDQSAIERFAEFVSLRNPRVQRPTVEVLNADTLQEFDLEMRYALSQRTVNTYVLTIRRFWAWCATHALSREYVETPPEARVLDLPAVPWSPPHAPTWGEMDRAIAAARGTKIWVRDAFAIMRFTGLRQRQTMSLKWADLDIGAMELTIRPELGKTRQEKSGRVIPVSRHLVEYLTERVDPERRYGPIVGPHRSCRWLDSHRDTVPVWEAAQVTERVWRGHPCHCFRYGFTSGLAALEADRESVEHLVGHAIAGARAHYLDPRWALKLQQTVDLIPPLGSVVQRQMAREKAKTREDAESAAEATE